MIKGINTLLGRYILALSISVLTSDSWSCTNLLITKGASDDGSVMVTYSADSHLLYGELYFKNDSSNTKADSIKIYEWDTGEYLGKIGQVDSTYKVVGNINEHQLVIAETTFGGRKNLLDSTGILDYGSLMYIALQRAKSAREAILLIDKLVSKYGYYSSGESFSIADPKEAWIMEIIGKGPKNKGAVWVARKIPDGYISGHANQARITTFPLDDPENCLYSDDVIEFAKKMGYFKGKDVDFSFADAYAPMDFESARFCEARVWAAFRRVNNSIDKYEDYAMGFDLKNKMPLWIKPDYKLNVQDVMELMRDYYQGTKMDMTKDIGSGPNKCIIRWRPLVWEYEGNEYFNERAISTQQTGFSFVSQSRGWLPDPVGGILWFGVDDTYSTVYTPIYCGIEEVPKYFAVGNGSLMEFSDSAAFWIFNQVSNFAYTRYNLIIPYIKEKQSGLENQFIHDVKVADTIATHLYKKDKAKVPGYLTAFSKEKSKYTFYEWKKLYGDLFVRFMDGNVKTPQKGKILPKLTQPGYDKEWYKNLIENTGEHFLIKPPDHSTID